MNQLVIDDLSFLEHEPFNSQALTVSGGSDFNAKYISSYSSAYDSRFVADYTIGRGTYSSTIAGDISGAISGAIAAAISVDGDAYVSVRTAANVSV